MTRCSPHVIAALAGCALAVACGSQSGNPLSPNASAASAQSFNSSNTHGQSLVAIQGLGEGTVNVSTTADEVGFSAEIEVNVHGAPPNTDFFVQRAPEIGRPLGADGICQRAAGLSPWGPPAPNFVTFPLPNAGPLTQLHTSAGGAGAVHLAFALSTIPDHLKFDVMFRLVDNLSTPTNELRTGCFTVTVK